MDTFISGSRRPVGAKAPLTIQRGRLVAKVAISSESQRRVVMAAEAVFREMGFKRGTVRQIAERCGMSVGAVASLGTKEQLLVRVVERKIADLTLDPSAQEHDTQSPADVVCERLDRFFDFFQSEWTLAREYASVLATGRYASDVLPGLADALVAEFSHHLYSPGEEPHRTRSRAQSIYLAYVGSLYLWTIQGLGARSSCEQHLHTAVRLLAPATPGATP